MDQEALLLAKMPVQRTAIPAGSDVNFGSQEIAIRVQDHGAKIVGGTLRNVPDRGKPLLA